MNNSIEVNNVTPELPQTGWFKSHEWADRFETEDKTFRKFCKDKNIPHKIIGRCMIVKAENLYEYSP